MYCRRCGAALHQGVVICPECGARQRRGISSVRCARCGHRVPLGLTVCPHCGRDVQPAGPRWGFWLAGFAIIALVALWGLDRLPLEKIKSEVASVQTRVSSVVQFLGPAASGSREAAPPQAAATPRPTEVTAALPATPTQLATEVVIPTETFTPTVEATATMTVVVTTAVTPTGTITPTLEPTPALSPTATGTPTLAPTATSMPASSAVTYKVKSGDTLSSIAAKFGISWQELAAANDMTSPSMLRVGQELVIPGRGATGPATAAPGNAAPAQYTVKSGDSLASIAEKYGITWQELAAANGLAASARLRIGQVLTIPTKGGATSATPTSAPSVAPTARPATPTAAVAALLASPELVSPGDQTPFSGSGAMIELIWKSVDQLPAGAMYRVSIQWIEEGTPREYLVPLTTATSIRMPSWLFGRADQPARKYSWSVRVVREGTDGKGGEKDILLSPASLTRVLYWN